MQGFNTHEARCDSGEAFAFRKAGNILLVLVASILSVADTLRHGVALEYFDLGFLPLPTSRSRRSWFMARGESDAKVDIQTHLMFEQ